MSLTDQFIVDGTFKVEKLEELVDSADGIGADRLISYKVKDEGKGKGKSAKFEKVKNVTVSDALTLDAGITVVVDVKKLTRLFVPTAGDVHFLCYDVKVSKDTGEFPEGLQASAVDQFDIATPQGLFDIKKPKRLCTPVVDTGKVDDVPDVLPLMCYSAKLAEEEAKHGNVKDLPVTALFLGEPKNHTVDVKKKRELCFISTITVPVLDP